MSTSRHKWTPAEDATLVASMGELHAQGHRNAETDFKVFFLPELEKLLHLRLPGCVLKAKPHIESRLKTLKAQWSIVYDMVHGQNTSEFGWDEDQQCVVAEEEVWAVYVQAHKETAPFKNKSFPYFEEMTWIYAKDRATGLQSQTVHEVLAVAEVEQASCPDENTELSEYANLPKQDTRESHPRQSQGNMSSNRKRKRVSEYVQHLCSEMNNVGTMIADLLRESVTLTDPINQQLPLVDAAVRSLEGVTIDEVWKAHRLFLTKEKSVLIFFGMTPANRLEWLRAMDL